MVALLTQAEILGRMNTRPNSGSFQPGQQTTQITGRKFGRLTVLSQSGIDKHGNSMWNCACDCGKNGIFKGRNLRIGKTKSCGCWAKEVFAKGANRKHGHTSRELGASPEYSAWKNMRRRCQNPNARDWNDYGGRGIIVSERWDTFDNFLTDMGVKPSPNLTIERINNNDGYSKENCIWATRRVQNRNKRDNVVVQHNGKSQTLTDWATELGIARSTLYARFRLGWSVKQAFATPILRKA